MTHANAISVLQPPHSRHGYLPSIRVFERSIFAVGGMTQSTILASSDGTHFYPRGSGPRGLRDVLQVGSRVFVCGEREHWWYTDDEGENWREIAHDRGPGHHALYAMIQVDDVLLAASNDGSILRLALADLSVTRLDTGSSAPQLRIGATANAIFLLGRDGAIRRAPKSDTPSGFVVVHETTAPLTQLCETAAGTVLVSGDGGQLLRSTDGGLHFESVGLKDRDDIEGVGAFADRIFYWGGGGLAESFDDGRTFESVPLPETIEQHGIWSAAAWGDAVLFSGDDGLVMRLGEAPKSWATREDRFRPSYPLDEVFEGGPDGFVGPRLRAFVVQINGIEEELEQVEEATIPTLQPQAEEPPAETVDNRPEQNRPLEQGEDAWKNEAIKTWAGLWHGDHTQFEDVWGCKPPAKLAAFERALRGANIWSTFEELRVDAALLAPRSGTNLFERLIINDQLNYLGTALPEAFGGLVSLGSLGNGDTYHLAVPHPMFEKEQVLFYDHETHSFEKEFADSLDSLVFLCALAKAEDEGLISQDATQDGYRLLNKRVSPSWHFGMEDRQEDFEDYESEENLQRLTFWRARWLTTLFRHDHGGDPNDVAGAFIERFNPVVTPEQTEKRMEIAKTYVPTALYAVWRAYVFEEDELESYLGICRNHPGRLARDAAALIDELRAGRKTLGRIQDWPAVLRAVRELDLDPRRASARQEEAEAEQRHRNVERQRLVEAMSALDGEALETFCWEHALHAVHRPALLSALVQRPGYERAHQGLLFLSEQGYCRENQIYRDEEADAARHTATHAPGPLKALLIGELIQASIHEASEEKENGRVPLGPATQDVAEMAMVWARNGNLPEVALELLRPVVTDQDAHVFLRRSAIAVLTLLKDRLSAPVLMQQLEDTPPEGGFETRLKHDDFAKDVAEALGQLGKKAHARVLVPFAASESLRQTPPTAALALARLDPSLGTETMLGRLLERTTLVNSHEETSISFLAYGLLGAARPLETHADLLKALLATEPLASGHNVEAARQFAVLHLTQSSPRRDGPLATTLRDALHSGGSRPEVVYRFVLLVAELMPELEAELAPNLVPLLNRSSPAFVHELSRVLDRQNIVYAPPQRLTWFDTDGLDKSGLIEALSNTDLKGRHHAVRRLAEHKSADTCTALETLMKEVLARAPKQPRADLEESDNQILRELTRAFSALQHTPIALYQEALVHPNRDVKGPVLRHPPAAPALADGMRVVAAEKWGWQESTARNWLKKFG